MKFGKIIYDPDEAEIGKKYIFSDDFCCLKQIKETDGRNNSFEQSELIKVHHSEFPFVDYLNNAYSFILEVIEEDQKYRPYESVEEMIEDFKKRFMQTNCPPYAMPLIWIENKDGHEKAFITMFCGEDDEVFLNGEFGYVNFYNLLDTWTFLDGTPCGKKVEE